MNKSKIGITIKEKRPARCEPGGKCTVVKTPHRHPQTHPTGSAIFSDVEYLPISEALSLTVEDPFRSIPDLPSPERRAYSYLERAHCLRRRVTLP